MIKVESFELDHRLVKAPYVRKVKTEHGIDGGTISKFDLRFMQPNEEVLPTAAIHTMEHLLAGFMREKLDGIIDISPMGCRTGFYLVAWGDVQVKAVIDALEYGLKSIIDAEEIPAANSVQCGNYKDHSLPLAKSYAESVVRAGISDDIYK